MEYKFLNQIDHPIDLKKYKVSDLDKIAKELRYKTIDAVSKTGGHLGAGLGVIELTIALHYIFDAPLDKITAFPLDAASNDDLPNGSSQ